MSDESTDDSTELELTASEVDRQSKQLRFALAKALGENIGGDQDYYEVFNWDKNPGVDEFYALALRNPYAYAVTFLPPNTTWRDSPTIVDDVEGEDGQTQFEKEVERLERETRIWHYGKRADKLAGIGDFGILVLEFDDTEAPQDFRNPVGNASELQGLRPFSRASIDGYTTGGPGSDRWGEPVEYQLDLSDENDQDSAEMESKGPDQLRVHHSRVIHIPSDELLDDEIRGVERQAPVYNNLIDIEKSLGSAGELAYRATAWGLNVNISEDFNLEDGGEQMREHLSSWYNGLEPILRTQGADDVQSLGGEEIDPSNIIDPNVEAISAQTGIPQSVLKGNETGERATTQDLKEWYGKITERRNEFVTPKIVRELIDRLIEYNVLTEPAGNSSDTIGNAYSVEWTPLMEMSEKDEADIQNTRAKTLKEWPFGEEWLTPEQQKDFVEKGKLPSELDTGELPALDEDSPEVQAQWDSLHGD